jgi:N-carbamoyl-L-amino-acid hydrolase
MPTQEHVPPGVFDLTRNVERHFAKLARIGIAPDGSIWRIAYSDEESAAMAYLRSEGETFGLEGRYDPVGNLILSTPGGHARRVLVGSHIDSVPAGGNFDGSAGLVAGLEAIRELLDEGVELERGIDLVAWRGEEYTFNAVYKGSCSAFGLSETHILHNRYGDQTLRDAILAQGFDPTPIDDRRPSFEPGYIDSIDAYFELHIEQGVRLEREGKDVGLVTSIAGDRRFLVVLEGRFDHSGATPMGARYRNDVNLAMAYVQVALDELGQRRRDEGKDFCLTVGIVNADPEVDRKYPEVHSNSVTKVSGLGYFTIDLMCADDTFMDEFAAEAHRVIWNEAKRFGVQAVIEQTDSAAGIVALSPELLDALQRSADGLGHSYLRMASGAGHDAVVVTQARHSDGTSIPTGMLFVPCRAGISHSRDEFVRADQVARGSEVLRETLRELVAPR